MKRTKYFTDGDKNTGGQINNFDVRRQWTETLMSCLPCCQKTKLI
jgi:hypothetical protein